MEGLSSGESSRASSPLKGSRPPGGSFALNQMGDSLRKVMGLGGNTVHPSGGSGSLVSGAQAGAVAGGRLRLSCQASVHYQQDSNAATVT
jgi:hypothetical protein